MAVLRQYKVAIPGEHVTIEKQSGKPALIKYVLSAPYNREKGYAQPKRVIIGHQCEDSRTLMYPTTKYGDIFPDEWEKLSGQTVLPSVKKFGMYAACQAVNASTGIKGMLEEVYGRPDADAIMDFAMYSVLYHSDVAQSLADRMKDEMLYLDEPYSDSSYSELFEHRMDREHELLFKKKWAMHCKAEGIEKVWLCIDGSNDDCKSRGVDIAEKGHAKSKNNVDIVSFTYAVTPDGMPVTWEVYHGGLVDAKAMKTVLDFLTECGISVQGVILDRGYCDANAISYLRQKKLAYVILIKGTPQGYQQIVSSLGNEIKMNAEYLIQGTCLFGVQKEAHLFAKPAQKDWITLYYDYHNGNDRVTTLLKNLYAAQNEAQKRLLEGKTPKNGKYSSMISIYGKHAVLNLHELQKAIDSKGLYGIVSSDPVDPKKLHDLYSSRNASEVQYDFVKNQLGYGTVRVHFTPGVIARFEVGFVASVIRYEIEQASLGTGRTANQMIHETSRIEMRKLNEAYVYSHTETDRVCSFLNALGVEKAAELIDDCVRTENNRAEGNVPFPRRRKTGPKKGSHHKKYDELGNEIKRKPGVKPGTKRPAINADGSVRKTPGTKPGTKLGKFNKDGSLRKTPGPKPARIIKRADFIRS